MRDVCRPTQFKHLPLQLALRLTPVRPVQLPCLLFMLGLSKLDFTATCHVVLPVVVMYAV